MIDPQADHPPDPETSPGILDRALALVEYLRSGCPWDAAQTPHSLRRYLLEEAHEVVDAIDGGDEVALRDELGDLLLNLAFQIVLAEERAAFDREEVVAGLEDKMRRRHPQLYGGEAEAWDALKARERGGRTDGPGLLGSLVAGADPVAHAHAVQAKAATVGFDWSEPAGAWAKVHEEVEEVGAEFATGTPEALEEEIGDLLFAIVNFARLAAVHPSTALMRANAKFTRRFGRVEELAEERGVRLGEAPLEALNALWNDVKKEEG